MEEAFLTTDRVFTASFHKFGGGYFPGTGDICNMGHGALLRCMCVWVWAGGAGGVTLVVRARRGLLVGRKSGGSVC